MEFINSRITSMLFLLLWELGIFNEEGLNGGILDSEDNASEFASGVHECHYPLYLFPVVFVLTKCPCLFYSNKIFES
jgi:hypothetical protein